MRRVVVTGLGAVTPLGVGMPRLVSALTAINSPVQVSAAPGNIFWKADAGLFRSRIEVPSLPRYHVRSLHLFQRVSQLMADGLLVTG